jgi:hypothetical protein
VRPVALKSGAESEEPVNRVKLVFAQQRGGQFNHHRILIKFHEGMEPGDRGSPVGDVAVAVARPTRVERLNFLDRTHVLHLEQADQEGALVDLLIRLPGVEYAEFDGVGYLAAVPLDPFWCDLWAFENRGQTVNGTAGTSGADLSAVRGWNVSFDARTIPVAIPDSGTN